MGGCLWILVTLDIKLSSKEGTDNAGEREREIHGYMGREVGLR